jgi:hypothetical protein
MGIPFFNAISLGKEASCRGGTRNLNKISKNLPQRNEQLAFCPRVDGGQV